MFVSKLKAVMSGQHLSGDEMTELCGLIMDGGVAPAQIAGFLVALRMKGETADEIFGAARAMRARMTRIVPQKKQLIDTCGTGGDGHGTFNISTAVALVL